MRPSNVVSPLLRAARIVVGRHRWKVVGLGIAVLAASIVVVQANRPRNDARRALDAVIARRHDALATIHVRLDPVWVGDPFTLNSERRDPLAFGKLAGLGELRRLSAAEVALLAPTLAPAAARRLVEYYAAWIRLGDALDALLELVDTADERAELDALRVASQLDQRQRIVCIPHPDGHASLAFVYEGAAGPEVAPSREGPRVPMPGNAMLVDFAVSEMRPIAHAVRHYLDQRQRVLTLVEAALRAERRLLEAAQP